MEHVRKEINQEVHHIHYIEMQGFFDGDLDLILVDQIENPIDATVCMQITE